MSVGGLKAVLVADDDEVAIAAGVLGDADLAGEGGADGITRLERQVRSLVAPAVADAELGEDLDLVGAAEVRGMVDQPEGHLIGQSIERNPIGVHSVSVPVRREIVFLLELVAVLDVFPGIVAVEDDLDQRVGRVKRIYCPCIGRDHGLDGLQARSRDDEFRLCRGEPGAFNGVCLRLLCIYGRRGQQQHHCQCFSKCHNSLLYFYTMASKRLMKSSFVSATFCRRSSSDEASQIKRRYGSVLDGRMLNHQSGNSTR